MLGRLGFERVPSLQAIFRGEDCAATGRAVMVTLDNTTRKPRALPPEIVAQLEPWKYRGE